jgi:hypothetical protein
MANFSNTPKTIVPFFNVIKSVQNSNTSINLLTINSIKKTENIIPNMDSLSIGSLSVLTLHANNIILSANIVNINGSINFKNNVYIQPIYI